MRPNNFQPYGMFDANHAPILRQDEHYLQTDRNELSLEPHHLRVPKGVSKMISEPTVRSTQTVQLSYVKISTISKWGELALEPRHLGVPTGASIAISKPMVRLAQNVHLSCPDTYNVSKWKEVRFHMTHVT